MNSTFHQVLTRISSPIGMAIVLGLFAIYALTRYFVFTDPSPAGVQDTVIVLLASQFATTMGLLVIVRCARDRRIFETIFVLIVVIPLISIATTAGMNAAIGVPVRMETLTATFPFSSLLWMGLAIQMVVAGAIVLWLRLRQKKDVARPDLPQ